MESQGDFAGAIAPLKKSVELDGGKNPNCLAALADAFSKTGRIPEAIQTAHRALDQAVQENDDQLAAGLRAMLQHYEQGGEGTQPQ